MGEVFAAVLMLSGCILCLIAAVGMLRLPDTLIRMHAATKAGTLGAGMVLTSVAVWYGETGIVLKSILALVFLFLTAPVAAHLIGRAAYRSGIDLAPFTRVDQLGDDMQRKRPTGEKQP